MTLTEKDDKEEQQSAEEEDYMQIQLAKEAGMEAASQSLYSKAD